MTWPPKWLQTHGRRKRRVSGEIGLLAAVFLSEVLIDKVYMVIYTAEGNTYIGNLTCENVDCAKAVCEFLYSRIGKSLTTIGSIDLPASFSERPQAKTLAEQQPPD